MILREYIRAILKEGRPIPIDKELIKTYLDEITTHIKRHMQQYDEPDKPLLDQAEVGRLFGMDRLIRLKDVREGEVVVSLEIRVVKPKFKNWSRLFVPGGGVHSRYYGNEQGVAEGYGTPWVLYLNLDGTVPPAAWSDKLNRHAIARELYSILIHEFTHLRDLLPYHGKQEHDSEEEEAIEYYNRPVEVRAFMQQVVDEVITDMEKKAVDTEGWYIDTAWDYIESLLEKSYNWQRIKGFLKPENKRKVLKAVARAVTDLHPELKEKYKESYIDPA